MFLRHFIKPKRASVAPVLAVILCVLGAGAPQTVWAAGAAVQSYVDQAVPPVQPAYYDTPLAAGTLTLQDVLQAHQAPDANLPAPNQLVPPASGASAPLLTPALEASSTSLMMEQGMKAVLQDGGSGAVTVQPPVVRPDRAAQVGGTQGLPIPLTGGASVPDMSANTAANAGSSGAPTDASADNFKYQPGQAPKNLAAVLAGSPDISVASTATGAVPSPSAPEGTTAEAAPVAAPASSPFPASPTPPAATAAASCDPHTKKWEKTCGDAGYPATFVGKISGETRMGCVDGAWHDFWVSNSCAPPDSPAATATAATSTTSASASVATPAVDAGSSEHAPVPQAITESAQPVPEAQAVQEQPATKVVENHTPVASEATGSSGEFCGPAAEILAYEAPDRDLCRVGTPSAVNGDGPWTWSCTDNDGRTSSCRTLSLSGDGASSASASTAGGESNSSSQSTSPRIQPASRSILAVSPSAQASSATTELACGPAASQPASSAPDQDLCSGGKASAVRGSGPWHWSCSKGSHKLSCHTAQAVDASCGSSNGATLESAPFLGLCASGTPTGVSGDGPWAWSCTGAGGGVSVSCAASSKNEASKNDAAGAQPAPALPSAATVDGVCGSSADVKASTQPADGLCQVGIAGPVTALGDNGGGPWSWTCAGSNGGHNASCIAPQAKTAASATPIKKKAKPFAAAPTPSTVPPPAALSGTDAPPAEPALSDDQPVPPPPVKDTIATAPVLQDSDTPPPATGDSGSAHLTLDPTISTILFTHGSGAIDSQVVSTLDKLAAVLLANPDVRITLTAYADAGNAAGHDARRLSLTRALAVRDYLGNKGIPNSRVDVQGEGGNTTGYVDRVDVKVNN